MVTYGILMVKASASKSTNSSAISTQEIKVSMEEFLAKAPRRLSGKNLTVETPVLVVFHGKIHGKSMENQ